MNTQLEIEDKFKIISDDVKAFVTKNSKLLEETGVYRGTQILFSPLRHKPKILFVGINPGAGYYNKEGKNVEKFEAVDELEYTSESFPLQRETQKLFEMAGCLDLLEEDALKTNWVFLATKNTKDLDFLLRKMLYENKFKDFYTMFDGWLRSIIEIVEPKIIICEGSRAFGRVTCNVLKLKYPVELGVGFRYAVTDKNIHVIGYERTYSNIRNKEKVAAKIKELVS